MESGVNKTQKQVHAAPLAEAQVYRAGPQKQGGDSVTRVLDCTNDEQRCVWVGGGGWDPCGRMLEDDGSSYSLTGGCWEEFSKKKQVQCGTDFVLYLAQKR